MRTRFEVKKVNVTRLIIAETETVLPTNFKLGRWLEHALPTATASYKGLWRWDIARGPVLAAAGDHTTCFNWHQCSISIRYIKSSTSALWLQIWIK